VRRPTPAAVTALAAATAVFYGVALWWVAGRYPLPRLDGRGAALLAAAVACEGAAKWEVGRLFRRSAARDGVVVPAGAAFRGALAGAAVARLVPLGGAVTPAAMAWAARAPSAAGARAAVHTTALNYAWLLVVGGAGAVWAGGARGGGVPLVATGTAAVVLGTALLVSTPHLARLGRRLPGRLGRAAGRLLPELEPDPASVALAGTRILWEAAALGLVFAAFRLGVGPRETLIAFGVSQIASGAPGPPGGVGVAEAGLVGTLALLGVPAETTVGPALVFRVVSYWLPALAGLGAGAAAFLAALAGGTEGADVPAEA